MATEQEESWDFEDFNDPEIMTPEGPSDMLVSELLDTPYPQDDADT